MTDTVSVLSALPGSWRDHWSTTRTHKSFNLLLV